MVIIEERRDLFLVPKEYSLVYTVGRDFLIRKGMGAKMKNRYPTMISTVKRAYKKARDPEIRCIGFKPLKEDRYIYNLLVKDKLLQTTTYEDIFDALVQLKDDMRVMDVKKIAMPKIGIGDDGLNWEKVKETIDLVFESTDVEILVCTSILDKDNEYIEPQTKDSKVKVKELEVEEELNEDEK